MASGKILLVEDDLALLEGLRDVLEMTGYTVMMARNGLEGLAALAESVPDLIVSDINMPRMDGYQFYSQVRARPEWVSLPFIFLTAKGEKSDIRRGKMLGADDYLTKPFDEADLLVAIQAKLNRRAELEAARERQVADLKRTILTTLNHEFRTPLTYITSYADIMAETDLDINSEQFREFMHGIQHGSDRLRRLVEDFILLVELRTGEAQHIFRDRRLVFESLAELLRRVLADLEERAEARHVSLVAEIPAELPAVLADPDYLADAITRVVDNAVKFSKKEGGQVIVAAARGEDGVTIQVRDQGIGMRADQLDKIFDVFYQIDRAKMEQQGSGSGLAIVQGIVNLHGGTLSVDSKLDVGSTFTIQLPEYKGESATAGR